MASSKKTVTTPRKKQSVCSICQSVAAARFLQCDTCEEWWCSSCINQEMCMLTEELFAELDLLEEFPWQCQKCVNMNLPEQLVNNSIFSVEELLNLKVSSDCFSPAFVKIDSTAVNKSQKPTEANPDEEFVSTSKVVSQSSKSAGPQSEMVQMMQMFIEMQERKEKELRIEREESRERREKELRIEREERRADERAFQERIIGLLAGKNETSYQQRSDGEGSSGCSRGSVPKTQIRLPKFTLPNFYGQVTEWTSFWETFQSSIHDNPDISTQMKFQYLSTYLKGDAANAIKGLARTAENYEVAINILKSQFGNDQEIKEKHVNTILQLPVMRDDLSNMKEFYQTLEVNLKSLETLGVAEIQGDLFLAPLKRKLPSKLLLEFRRLQRLQGIQKDTLLHLRNFLETYLKDMDLDQKKHTGDHQKNYAPKSTAAALVGHSSTPFSQLGCAFCQAVKGSHFSSRCPVVTDPKARAAIVKENCLCPKCLFPKEHRYCNGKTCFKCNRPGHHYSICFKEKTPIQPGKSATSLSMVDPETVNKKEFENQAFLMTVKGKIRNQETDESLAVNIFLDTGSQHSFIRSEIADKLKLKSTMVNSQMMAIGNFGTTAVQRIPAVKVGFQVKSSDGAYFSLNAYKIPEITAPLPGGPLRLPHSVLMALKEEKVSNLSFSRCQFYTIDVLVGADHFSDICQSSEKLSDGVSLFRTCLGQILFGQSGIPGLSQSSPAILVPALVSPSTQCQSFKDEVERFWDLESIGIHDDPILADDENAMAQFKSSIQRVDGRYQVSWPWKNINVNLPSNFKLALERLRNFFTKKLLPNKDFLMKYDSVFQEQKRLGIIEAVPKDEVFQPKHVVHYIPHHAVIQETSATTKLRVVYDASAKTKHGSSLNDHLLRGPVLLSSLIGLLLRFRMLPFVAVSDVEKAFLQVGLNESQRDVTRFLWLQDPMLPLSSQNLEVFRFCRVPFGVVSSPFLLAATINHHLEGRNSTTAEKIRHNIYVDNVFLSATTETEMERYYKEAKELFKDIKMNLRAWTFNSKLLMNKLPTEDKGQTENIKVLGMSWNSTEDVLSIKEAETNPSTPTKRNLLKCMASIFDPLGLLSPVLVPAKCLFQSLWKENLDWDTELGLKYSVEWDQAMSNISSIPFLKFPRFLQLDSKKPIQLLCFVDASDKAYGACIYGKQNSSCHLLCSKSRLAPVNRPSVPRLELLAVLMGVRLLNFVKAELDQEIESLHMWSDSQIVLSWIHSSRKRTVFVENRLTEIRKTPQIIYHKVFSKENPADLTTKGSSVNRINSLWWEGPSWISTQSDNEWSVWTAKDEEELEACFPSWISTQSDNEWSVWTAKDEEELEACLPAPSTVMPLFASDTLSPAGISIQHFSSLTKLLRVTALVLRFVKNCSQPRSTLKLKAGVIQSTEIQAAQKLWLKFCQRTALPHIFQTASKLQEVDMVKSLKLFLDNDQIVRSCGRLQNSPLPFESNNPVLLPKNHHYTYLVINDIHKTLFHAGVEQTLNKLRQQFWVTGGRTQVRGVLRKCTICRKAEGCPFRPPEMPPLPSSRVTPVPAFMHVGIDLAGPLYLKSQRTCYIYVFVCMVTRAVHLELVDNKDANSFLQAYSKFCSRRGVPDKIITDNATQFQKAKIFLSTTLSHQQVSRFVLKSCVKAVPEWSFIPPAAPWMGGFYERVIGILKRSLRKNLGTAVLNKNQLETLVIAIEAIINTRPLTFVGSDIEDGYALTPAHFIAPSTRLLELPYSIGTSTNYNPSSGDLFNMWKKGQTHLTAFWKEWQNNYLLSLRSKNLKEKKHQHFIPRQPVPGEIVLVHDPQLPRSCWKLGQVVKLIFGKDGRCRSCEIKLGNGKLLVRPVQKLFPMEMNPVEASGGECHDDA